MKILVVYATTQGQTARIAHFAFDRLVAAGHSVALIPAAEAAELAPERFDAVCLAGSVHAGRYQGALVEYARAHRAALQHRPTLFLSVSLSAAGTDPGDRKGLAECIDRFVADTGWQPGRVEQVAGAFKFSEYGFFEYWAMRWIAAQRDETVTAGEDREYTDWDALGTVLDDWAAASA